jgi:copper chaperone
MPTARYRVDGMTCEHCARAVTRAIEAAVPGARVAVDLAAHRVSVTADATPDAIRRAVETAGYGFGGEA